MPKDKLINQSLPPPTIAVIERTKSTGSHLSWQVPPPSSERRQSAMTFLSNAESSYISYVYSEEEEEEDDYLMCGAPSMPDAVTATREISAVSALSIISDGGYRFWSLRKAKRYMEDTVREASDLLCIPPEATTVLLRIYKWDGKKLVEDFFGNKQQDILAEGGVLMRCSGSDQTGCFKSTGSCAICFDNDLSADELFSMGCGHEFCKTCWSGYISEAVSRGQRCIYTKCPHPKCNEVITEQEVTKLAPDALAKFQEYQLRSYVETNWLMRWCPGASCDRVAVGSSAGLIGEGQCKCGTRFCLRCGETRHDPATCDMMMLWNDKGQDERQTANWILTRTKKCPSCKTRIDKNGGCNRMACTQCNYQFCWMCMQDWNVHGYERTCNKFELDRANKMDSQKDHAERELEQYLHYFIRFQSHSRAQEFAKGELEKFGQMQDEKEKSESSFDWNALKDALGQLVECRRVLKYTYVVTYCLTDRPMQRELFEDHQALLERFTERLSEISERDHHSIDRTELVNLTRIVSRYAKSVMDCEIDEGML